MTNKVLNVPRESKLKRLKQVEHVVGLIIMRKTCFEHTSSRPSKISGKIDPLGWKLESKLGQSWHILSKLISLGHGHVLEGGGKPIMDRQRRSE